MIHQEIAATREDGLLSRLGDHPRWVLFWGPWDGDPESECFWLLHERNEHDKGLEIIGYGRTPEDVLRRALMEEDILKTKPAAGG